nr:hypothetical protein [Tanacetum cinerariifolium]
VKSVSVKKLHRYGHLEEIVVKRVDRQLYKFKEGPAYNILKGTCSSSIKLEYHFQECFNALTYRLDWNNTEGDRYPFDMSTPLPLQGHPDDDNEDPPTRPNLGKKTKRRRTKESESSKKPSTTKETHKGKASSKGSKTSKSALIKEPVEEPTTEVVMDDVGDDLVHDDDQPQDAFESKTAKTPNPEWFTQPPRPSTLDPEWNKRHDQIPTVDLEQESKKSPLEILKIKKEQAEKQKMLKFTIKSTVKENLKEFDQIKALYQTMMQTSPSIEILLIIDCVMLSWKHWLDWNNTEGDRYPFDMSTPLPLQGHPGHLTIAADYFFNNDIEYQKYFDPERMYTTSITKTKIARYEIEGIKDMGERRKLWHRSQLNKFSKHNVYFTKKIIGVKSVSVKKLHRYGHLEEIVVKRVDRQLYKFKEGDFVDLHMNDIEDMLLLAV